MSVKVSKMWKDQDFFGLSPTAKLVYIYLSQSPSINSLGLLSLAVDLIRLEIGIEEDDFREACLELVNSGFINVYRFGSRTYFLVIDHFNSLPNSYPMRIKAQKDVRNIPIEVLERMEQDGVLPDIEEEEAFTPPTVEEVQEYALSKGHIVDGETFISYYERQAQDRNRTGWCDGRGKQVKNWKAKLRNVWFKQDNKLVASPDAPEGFEYFVARDDQGRIIQPLGWRNGKPYGDNMVQDKLLKAEFEKSSK